MFPFVRCQLRLRPGRCGVGGTNVPLAPATVAEPGRQWPCAPLSSRIGCTQTAESCKHAALGEPAGADSSTPSSGLRRLACSSQLLTPE